MSSSSEQTSVDLQWASGLRLAVALLLLATAAFFTWRTIEGLSERRRLRTELAEISHVRYGLLDVDRWVEKIVPIVQARIDAIDLKSANLASLKPMVENALYRLLDDVKAKMSTPAAPPNPNAGGLGGLLSQGNALMANMMIGALKPHVPEYADVVLSELGKPETKQALQKYLKGVLNEGVQGTFGKIDTRWYSYILKQHGCADAEACRQVLGNAIRDADTAIGYDWTGVLLASTLAFVLLLTGARVLRRPAAAILLAFCLVLLLGGVLTPMIEVEAKISKLSLTFLGSPIVFGDQVLYYQSKSVLEVFHTLITQGRPDMWVVGVLLLTFSVIFPTLKISTAVFCMFRPAALRQNRLARFLVLESSKWSMADVMAIAIFMAYVAFNGLIGASMNSLKETGAQLVLPTDSSKLLPGYYLFIGFCLASLFLAKRLEHGFRVEPAAPISPAGE